MRGCQSAASRRGARGSGQSAVACKGQRWGRAGCRGPEGPLPCAGPRWGRLPMGKKVHPLKTSPLGSDRWSQRGANKELWSCGQCVSASPAFFLPPLRSFLGLRTYLPGKWETCFPVEVARQNLCLPWPWPSRFLAFAQTVGSALLFQWGGDTSPNIVRKARKSHLSASNVLSCGAAVSVTFNWLILGTVWGPHCGCSLVKAHSLLHL